VRGALALAVVVACAVPGTAHAGRTFFGWLIGPEVMPERGVELQQWTWEEDDVGPARDKQTWFQWSAHVGVTDKLELVLPTDAVWAAGHDQNTFFSFKHYGIEARYRFVTQDPVNKPAFAPLLRVGVQRDIQVRDDTRIVADLVLAYDGNGYMLEADLGAALDLTPNDAVTHTLEYHPGLGASFRVTDELHLGGEAFAELNPDDTDHSWAAVGPDLSWTHGRFWFSAVMGIGVYHINVAPRIQWGIAF
jgi:hypothetical protein